MTYFLFGAALVGLFYVLGRLFVAADAAALARSFKWVLIVLGVILAALLVLRGQMLLAGLPAAMAALGWRLLTGAPMLFRLWQLWRGYHARSTTGFAGGFGAGPSPGMGGRRAGAGGAGTNGGGSSAVDTRYLRMRLDLATGAMSGTVRRGAFAGRELESMSLHEQIELLVELHRADPQGVSVLEAYLDRRHGPDWRAELGAGRSSANGGGGSRSHSRGNDRANGGLTRDEALAILGLRPGAGVAEIKEAHRRLMMRYHPDRGGTDYLAAKINQAKDTLIDGR